MTQNSQENVSVNNDSDEYNSSQSLGRYLQKERLQKQLSLEEVAAQTCISLGTLRAIEENDRSKMPAEVFTRGFIKLYAQFLGLDPQVVLDRYNSETGHSHSDEETIRNHEVFQNEKMAESSMFFSLRIFLFILIFFLVFVGVGIYFFFYSSSSTPTTSSYSSDTGQNSLSSQINQKFHTVETPTQSPSFSPPSQGDTYSTSPFSTENNSQRENNTNEVPVLPPNSVSAETPEGSPASAATATESDQNKTPNNNTQGIFTPVR